MLTITDRAIRSTLTPHAAGRTSGGGEGGWRVSWLAGRVLSAGQAQAAMLVAEAACDLDAGCDPELYDPGFWSRLDAWAGQLGMPGPAALALAAAVLTGELTAGQLPAEWEQWPPAAQDSVIRDRRSGQWWLIVDDAEMSDSTLTVLDVSEPPRRHDITIRVPAEPGSHPDPAAFAVAASQAAAARDASILSAHTAEEIICVVSVHAATGPGAAAVALAVVADGLKAGQAVPSPSR